MAFLGGSPQPVFSIDPISGLPVVNYDGYTSLNGDARPDHIYSVDVTLGAADAVSSFAIPAGARGFQILSASARIRFAIDAAPPAAFSTTNAASNTGTGYLGAYQSVATGNDVARLFDKKVPGTLQFNSEVAGATFTLEFF